MKRRQLSNLEWNFSRYFKPENLKIKTPEVCSLHKIIIRVLHNFERKSVTLVIQFQPECSGFELLKSRDFFELNFKRIFPKVTNDVYYDIVRDRVVIGIDFDYPTSIKFEKFAIQLYIELVRLIRLSNSIRGIKPEYTQTTLFKQGNRWRDYSEIFAEKIREELDKH